MNRLIIESLEARILTGITMFVAVMVLIGWVAINEPGRMAAFERQHTGRSIERGGELYAANCATCHGTNGYGQGELVPALNNPQLFGYNFFGTVNDDIARMERLQVALSAQSETLTKELNALTTEFTNTPAPSEERKAEIAKRIEEINASLDATKADSIPSQIAKINTDLAPLIAERQVILDSLQVAMDKGYLPGVAAVMAEGGLPLTEAIERDVDRLVQAGWGSDVASFIRTTLYHGRPGTASVWQGKQMVAWAQVGGGPLRTDQINDLVNYIVNWDKGDDWTTEDLFAVQQFMKLKADASLVSAGERPPTIGTDVTAAVAAVSALTGDAAVGEALYTGAARGEAGARLGCSGCHLGGASAPATDLTWDNTVNVRLQDAALAGYTPEQYIIESIVNPNAYAVPGYATGVMPQNFGDQLTAQDTANIIAYLKSYSK